MNGRVQHIAFRIDAGKQIGTGHFMRCLTLADALSKRDAHIRFVSRDLPMYLRDMLTAKGIEFVSLESCPNSLPLDELAHAHWLGTSQAQDARDTREALSDQIWDWLIVDHYALDTRWESVLRSACNKIMVIDDIADRKHDCDVLLDQNFYTDMQTRYADKVPADCQLLLGPRYALLRDEFRRLRKQVQPRTGAVKRILVFFGGVDLDNLTGQAIKALAQLNVDGLQVDVVIGTQHPAREEIETNCTKHGFKCHVQTDRMAELMAAADLAIGAGGSASWERCCLGLPTLTMSIAENQQQLIADSAEECLLYAPTLKTDLVTLLKVHVAALIDNPHLCRLISRRAMQTVDGIGAMRVIGSLACGGITMRFANQSDSLKLFEWRNHPSIRSVSRMTDLIPWQTHQRWFSDVLASQDRILLIGETGKESIGVVRFDQLGDFAEISIYLVPDSNHVGQGRYLLQAAEQWLLNNRPEITHIRASVQGENVPSQRLFLGSGYRVVSTMYLKKLN